MSIASSAHKVGQGERNGREVHVIVCPICLRAFPSEPGETLNDCIEAFKEAHFNYCWTYHEHTTVCCWTCDTCGLVLWYFGFITPAEFHREKVLPHLATHNHRR